MSDGQRKSPIPLAVPIETVDGETPISYLSTATWKTSRGGDSSAGAAITAQEFLDEKHHLFYGRPWILGRYCFEYLEKRGLRRSDKVLDAGCGAGRVGVLLIEYLDTGHYFGVDSHLRSLVAFSGYEVPLHDLARKRPRLLWNSAFDVGSFDVDFDVALDIFVTFHLAPDAIQIAYEKIAACMKSGGRVFTACAPNVGVEFIEGCGFSLTHVEKIEYPLFALDERNINSVDYWHEFTRL